MMTTHLSWDFSMTELDCVLIVCKWTSQFGEWLSESSTALFFCTVLGTVRMLLCTSVLGLQKLNKTETARDFAPWSRKMCSNYFLRWRDSLFCHDLQALSYQTVTKI